MPAFAAFGSHFGQAGIAALLALAVACTLGCLIVRAWGSSYLTAGIVWSVDARTDSLVAGGPFRYTRNPLYVGNALLAYGFALLAPPSGAAFIVIANGAFIAALIGHEERAMLQRYGGAFVSYCVRVPRFFPRLIPAPVQSGTRPSIVQGLLAEIFTASVAAGVFAWILAPAYGAYAFIALCITGDFTQRALERAQQIQERTTS